VCARIERGRIPEAAKTAVEKAAAVMKVVKRMMYCLNIVTWKGIHKKVRRKVTSTKTNSLEVRLKEEELVSTDLSSTENLYIHTTTFLTRHPS
jgi:hypothetical protein